MALKYPEKFNEDETNVQNIPDDDYEDAVLPTVEELEEETESAILLLTGLVSKHRILWE